MAIETLMTTEAATTTEGQAASEQATQQAATGAEEGGQQQQAVEGQGEQGQQAEGVKTEEGDKAPEGAPENYEEFTAPEGVTLDAEISGELKSLAKELNLPQGEAQKVADLGAKMAQKWAAQQTETFKATNEGWVASAKADKEFGGDKLPENMAIAKKALDTFGTQELHTLLNDTGMGNHPEIIRAFYRAGKAISEDRLAGGKAEPGAPTDPAKVLFPNQK